ncbi:unnamed protein product, partial [Polarella glacialis]
MVVCLTSIRMCSQDVEVAEFGYDGRSRATTAGEWRIKPRGEEVGRLASSAGAASASS